MILSDDPSSVLLKFFFFQFTLSYKVYIVPKNSEKVSSSFWGPILLYMKSILKNLDIHFKHFTIFQNKIFFLILLFSATIKYQSIYKI